MPRRLVFVVVALLSAGSLASGCQGRPATPELPPPEPEPPVTLHDGGNFDAGTSDDGGSTPQPADGGPPDGGPCDPAALDGLFAARIAPLLDEDHVASCNRCHFGGVDFSAFARPSPCESMACLVDLGWADLDAPEESLLLTFIDRAVDAGPAPDGGEPPGITAGSIAAEHEAMLEWLTFSAACHDEVCGDVACVHPDAGSLDGGGPVAPELVYDGGCGPPVVSDDPACTPAAELALFLEEIWVWKGRCEHCHSEASTVTSALPRWMADPASADAPVRTLCTIHNAGYLDVDSPAQSLLLLKPLATAHGGVAHGGGTKFSSPEDAAYQSFLAYAEQYASCRTVVDGGASGVIDAGDLDAGPDGVVDSGSAVDGGT